MRENSSYKRYSRCITAAFLLMLAMILGTVISGMVRIVELHAEEESSVQETQSTVAPVANKTGTVQAGRKNVRIRTSTDTSNTDNVITMVDGGFELEILDTVKVTDTYVWYKVSFFYNGTQREGYISAEYVDVNEEPVYSEDMDFEEYLTKQNFPESYKDGLRMLHAKYPKWVFVADHVSNDWNDVVKNENVLGRSLISKNSISSWKSTETVINSDGSCSSSYYNWEDSSWYTWDGGNWVQASVALLEYVLDPRNFLNETNIFMFEKLSYDKVLHNREGVLNVIGNTFMKDSSHDLSYEGKKYDYADAILYAGQVSGVSPYHLTSRIIQEQGTGGTGRSISGTIPGYTGYYNYFNVSASAGGTGDPVVNGLAWASKSGDYLRPWNSRMRSIIGGATYIGKGYINRGQDTIYYEKFDLVGYWHQYMTHVLAPRSESVKSSQAYTNAMKASTALVFHIPVYKNMPATVCKEPVKDGSPNNTLNSLTVEGYALTPSFQRFAQSYDLIVEHEVTKIQVKAGKADSSATVSGDGEVTLAVGNNQITVTVTAANGDPRSYVINVVRKEGSSQPPEPPTQPPTEPPTQPPTEPPSQPPTEPPTQPPTEPEPVYEYKIEKYHLDAATGFLSGIEAGNTRSDMMQNITITKGVTAKLLYADGSENTDKVTTGSRLIFYRPDGTELGAHTIVLYGDTNGDGEITSMDALYMRRHVLGIKKLEGVYLAAADTDKAGNGCDSMDMLYIRRHILNIRYIVQ